MWGKYFELFGPKGTWNGLKMRFFRYCQRSVHETFLIVHKRFFGENSVFVVFRSKRTQSGPKLRFFRYYQKSMHQNFLIFQMKLQQHKGLKLNKMLFWRFLAKRGPSSLKIYNWLKWFFRKILHSCLDKKCLKMSFLSFIINWCNDF